MNGLSVPRAVVRIHAGRVESVEDPVAVEGALEIRIDGRPLAVTLRTPGHDRELALGFLVGEGVLRGPEDVAGVEQTPAPCADQPDLVDIRLATGVAVDWARLERHFAATSACGLCGRAHLDSLRVGLSPMTEAAPVRAEVLLGLADRLRPDQHTFLATGGLHAAAFCESDGAVVEVREDVGRHNAVDKIAGALLAAGRRPATTGLLWVSGRAGAEIVLKAARAGIPLLAAVGAPSSLAIELAEVAGLTLVGFLREGRMNVYAWDRGIAV